MVKPVQGGGRVIPGNAVLLPGPAQALFPAGVDKHVQHISPLPQHPARAPAHQHAGPLLGQPLDNLPLQHIELVCAGDLWQLAQGGLPHGHQGVKQGVGVRLLQLLNILWGGAAFPGRNLQNLPAVDRDAQGLAQQPAHLGAAAGVFSFNGDNLERFHPDPPFQPACSSLEASNWLLYSSA